MSHQLPRTAITFAYRTVNSQQLILVSQ